MNICCLLLLSREMCLNSIAQQILIDTCTFGKHFKPWVKISGNLQIQHAPNIRNTNHIIADADTKNNPNCQMLIHNLQRSALEKPLNDVQDPLFEKQGRSETEVGPQSICKFSAQLSTSKSLRDVSHQISLPQDMSSCID